MNVLHNTIKHPHPRFFVDLEPTDHSNQTYQLYFLLHAKVKVEESYKPKLISQCQNCQDYGHTRSTASQPPQPSPPSNLTQLMSSFMNYLVNSKNNENC
ncbi:Uncharacterized protein FWK35_00019600 [Aphis craccivora]|uniref:Uncharacterized protein n=1 Tax=Aphis craccivora TaxID=307492 RepID=A0A6G0WB87_APHCR|nr:Uncharacterized protein FWK35_00019600 [Aphis craccivora]